MLFYSSVIRRLITSDPPLISYRESFDNPRLALLTAISMRAASNDLRSVSAKAKCC
jgi:hypothetical protein